MSAASDPPPEVVLIGGREPVRIRIVAPDPRWPERYAAERARIAGALGEAARSIHHIGSTAVPGLAAKPIIDVMAGVDDLDESRLRAALEAVGYGLRVREPGHLMFRTPARDVHVHIVAADSEDLRRHLVFRDRLRACPADRAAYEALKRELATRDWADMNQYAQAKGELIAQITARARAAEG